MSRHRKPPQAARRLAAKASGGATPTVDRPVPRQPWLDALRGVAVLAMIAYHFGYDLNFLGWLHQDLNHDLRWMTARSLILSSFLFSVGASHALAEAQHAAAATHWRRIGKITAAALLVTAGSALLFPQSAIWFGTLHAIATMSMLLLLLQRLHLSAWTVIVSGVIALAFGNLIVHPLFDHPALSWIGLMTHAPFTEDYVPLLPWFGICLIGDGAMRILLSRGFAQHPAGESLPSGLRWIGRHSLAIYLLHQPVLLAILMPLTHWLKPA